MKHAKPWTIGSGRTIFPCGYWIVGGLSECIQIRKIARMALHRQPMGDVPNAVDG